MTWTCILCARPAVEEVPLEAPCPVCRCYVRAHRGCAEQHSESSVEVIKAAMVVMHQDRNRERHCPGRIQNHQGGRR